MEIKNRQLEWCSAIFETKSWKLHFIRKPPFCLRLRQNKFWRDLRSQRWRSEDVYFEFEKVLLAAKSINLYTNSIFFVYTLLLRSPQYINGSSSSTSSLFICTNSRNELYPGLGLVNCTTNYEPRTSLWLASKLSSSVVKYKLIMGNIETHPGPMTSSQQSSQPLILYLEQLKTRRILLKNWLLKLMMMT